MNVTLFVTVTANGFIADINGEENFFDEYNWDIFKKIVVNHRNVIYGRKTYEMIVGWGEEYIKL